MLTDIDVVNTMSFAFQEGYKEGYRGFADRNRAEDVNYEAGRKVGAAVAEHREAAEAAMPKRAWDDEGDRDCFIRGYGIAAAGGHAWDDPWYPSGNRLFTEGYEAGRTQRRR